MDAKPVNTMKMVLLISSLASIVIFTLAAYHENFRGDWRRTQHNYKRHLIETAPTARARTVAESFEIGHKQLYLPELSRIDRCTTCHLGVENPAMVDAAPPLQTHTGQMLVLHPPEQFGCTICHQGQGRAVEKARAHGRHEDGSLVAHTMAPLLHGKAVYTSCSKCHYEPDLFGGLADLHAKSEGRSAAAPIDEKHLRLSLPGATDVAQGKKLLVQSGCLGCHKYRGRGGVLGPDITYIGEKTKHDFDFSYVRGEHTVKQWLFEHFKYPQEVSPGTVMPDLGHTEQQALALTSYMLSLHRKSAPASLRPQPLALLTNEIQPVRGETLYNMFCSACHGSAGTGSTMRTGLWPVNADPWGHNWDARDIVREQRSNMEVLVPSLNNPDTLAVVSDQYLRRVIEHGRPGTKMLAWKTEGGLSDDEITLLVAHIRSWQPRGAVASEVDARRGVARVGQALYRSNCAACHGANGEGALAVSLNSPTFLAVASDQFLRDTIMNGRPNTAMPAWREFDAREISDLIAFMRVAWHPTRADVPTALALSESADNDAVSAKIGQILYKANCVMCHGDEGQGDLGPSLNTPEFLSIARNDYLLTTLIAGRPGTAMPAWRHLSNEDLASLVKHLRSWQSAPAKNDAWYEQPHDQGDAQLGELLFASHCAGCHGDGAQGAIGPQLSNPVFLQTANDVMLREWIAKGKSGTQMRAFRRGGQGIVELSERHIGDLVAFLRSLEGRTADEFSRIAKSPCGRPEKGALLYAQNCSACHGLAGEGASGPALSNPYLLKYASDGFLLATMALGRYGTEMRPVKAGPQSILSLSSDEVNDVLAYLRSWEYASPFDTAPETQIPHRFVVPWDLEAGRALFVSNCAGCHGANGTGLWAPELNNEGFLAAATDGFLQATIVRGRHATAMRPFGAGGQGLSDLTTDQIDNLVAYIRSWSTETPSPMTIPAERSLIDGTPDTRPTAQSQPIHRPIALNKEGVRR